MTPETFVKAQLAEFAYREAFFHGGHDNMFAVAFVMRNRQKAGMFGGNMMAILEATPSSAAAIYPRIAINLHDINTRLLLQQIDDIYSGLAVDRMTEGAVYYAELNRVERQWFKDNILARPDVHPRVATIGNVSFFR